jgi:DNA polymerase-3 subunit alpha
VALAFDYADTQLANADQGGLFDFGDSHAASTNEPDLVLSEPWGLKEQLTLEKTAIGFYLSGHLFDEAEAEVRRFAKQRIADLQDSREVQVVTGIISDLRVINGTRGRVGLFKLDDKSESIEAVANQDTLDANKELLKDDELVIIQGKVQTDRFSGGLRLNVQQVWSLAAARCRFARFVRVTAKNQHLPVADVLREFPARRVPSAQPDQPETIQGLPIRVVVERQAAELSARGELDLGESARVYPSDQALARFKELMPLGQAQIVYGEG